MFLFESYENFQDCNYDGMIWAGPGPPTKFNTAGFKVGYTLYFGCPNDNACKNGNRRIAVTISAAT